MLWAALYGYAFIPALRCRAPGSATASVLAWLECHSLPVSGLSDPQVIRAALNGLCVRLDGSPAATANTITRKRAVFHNALGYAVELGLLPANPVGKVRWHAPKTVAAVSPQAVVASPAQVQAILAQAALMRADLAQSTRRCWQPPHVRLEPVTERAGVGRRSQRALPRRQGSRPVPSVHRTMIRLP
jgi:hypothetical protein